MPRSISRQAPELAHIVLSQLSRMFNAGALTEDDLEQKLSRLQREELSPRGLHWDRQPRPDGKVNFIISADYPSPTTPANHP